ncbi:2-dehydro-3-deoxygalactonokinase [Vibrio ishigakensis]|uniref:2-dehydro-3-deoxygalactonokinase n=2 Tax=Vibrio ishigakensis TaxID=1481914 RepID=A0A0B8NWQ8_9VIBR|nr:2-dehydro-3-deoxygalactonokinase [Vibrio ishigakensis]
MNSRNELVGKIEKKMGLLQVNEGRFAEALQLVLEEWLGEYQSLPIVMAGMVGSAQGWVNVPYVETPVSVNELARESHRFTLPWGADAVIVPGISHADIDESFDVMRGEEVQLFGLLERLSQSEVEAVFPGTHSKHIRVEEGRLTSFRTYMTGELFSALSEHTILGRGLPEQSQSSDSYLKGVQESHNGHFTNQLFKTRTHRLFENLPEVEVHEYLSGLLIGSELRQLDDVGIYLVGGEKLCERYTQACDYLEKPNQFVSGDDCFLVGMLIIKEALAQHEPV